MFSLVTATMYYIHQNQPDQTDTAHMYKSTNTTPISIKQKM